LEIDQLLKFKAIARKCNISQAARDLYVSQQSLGRTLKQLEAELGVELFERDGKHLKINRYGEILLHYADIAEQSLQNAEDELAYKTLQREHAVRIIFRAQLGDTASLISSFTNQYPNIQVHVNTENETHGDQDLELVRLPEPVSDASFTFICEDPWLLLVNESHPLAHSTREIEFAQLENENFLFCSNVDSEEFLRSVPEIKNLRNATVERFPQPWNVVQATDKGMGITFAPATTWANSKELHIKALPVSNTNRTSYLYIRTCKEPTRASSSFAEFLKLHLQASAWRHEQ
jgi:LysR family transcriptional regulator, transcription activator of glutamate synthase operon